MSHLTAHSLIPGADLLGFSINLATATGPTDVVQRFGWLDTSKGQQQQRGHQAYFVPDAVDVTDKGTMNTTASAFASLTECRHHLARKVGVEASEWGGSSWAAAVYSRLEPGEAGTVYGLVEDESIVWNTALKPGQPLRLAPGANAAMQALPTSFAAATQAAFFHFLDSYGTHVITAVQVGGLLRYAAVVRGAAGYSPTAARTQLGLEYDGVFARSASAGKAYWEAMNKNWLPSRTANLSVSGGNAAILSFATPPHDAADLVNYHGAVQNWRMGLLARPGVVGTRLLPLSGLAPAAVAPALEAAIRAYLAGPG